MTEEEIIKNAKTIQKLGFPMPQMFEVMKGKEGDIYAAWNNDINSLRTNIYRVSPMLINYHPILEENVEDVYFGWNSPRIVRACRFCGIKTVRDLVEYSEGRFMNIPSIGEDTMIDLSQFFSEKGLFHLWRRLK